MSMTSPRTTSRPALLALFAVLTASAYYLILFTNWGNPYHGGKYLGAVLTEGVAVLAAFACLEVVRTEKVLAIRVLAGVLGVPLILVVLLTLWYGLRRYVVD
jgi:hypothetical protein